MTDLTPRVGVGVIVLRDDLVSLGRRIGSHGAGSWALPGGHLEFGETVEQCAAREVSDETGLDIQVVARGPYMNNMFPKEGKHYVTLFVVAHAEAGVPWVREPSQCSAWHWFRWTELPRPLPAAHQPLRLRVRAGDYLLSHPWRELELRREGLGEDFYS